MKKELTKDDIAKLELHKTYRYAELCELFDEKISKGMKSKRSQLKEWHRYFNWTNPTSWDYYITEIYSEPKEKEPHGNKGKRTTRYGKIFQNFPNFNMSYEQGKERGVYALIKDNNIYIGSTITSFYERMSSYGSNNGQQQHVKDLLKSGATFNILYKASPDDSDEIIRYQEQYYINQYLYHSDYNVINRREDDCYLPHTKITYKSIQINQKYIDDVINFCNENNIEFKIKENKTNGAI